MAFTTIQGSGGAPDSFLGTAGVDVIALVNQTDATFLSARQANDTVQFNSFTNVLSAASLYGGQGNDQLTDTNVAGTLSASFVAQNEGNDTITLSGVTSSTIQGNEGNDAITIGGLLTSSLVNGNQGNDTLNVAQASGGSVFGGSGFDQINVTGNQTAARIQANNDDDIITLGAGNTYNGSTINGNQGADTITVNAITRFATSTIFGGAGNDNINAAGSTVATVNLTISTDDGNDTVIDGAGADTITNSAGNDSITLNTGSNSFTATEGNNSVTLAATILAGTTNTVAFGTGNDSINGAAALGQLVITDTAGANTLIGGTVVDSITGGNGRDTITGGLSADNLTGGAGADQFVFTSGLTIDTVADFTLGTAGDALALSTGGIAQVNYVGANVASTVGAAYTLSRQTAAAAVAFGNTQNILVLEGATFANLAAAEAAIEGGTRAVTNGNAATSATAGTFAVVWADTAGNTHFSQYTHALTVAANAAYAAGSGALTDLSILSGINASVAGTFVTANISNVLA